MVALLLGLTVRPAHADRVAWLVGSTREIERSTSANRDAPNSALVFASRVRAMAAVDLGIADLPLGGVHLRPGFSAFFELEHAETGVRGPLPLPGLGNGPMLWRGQYALSLALSARALAKRWLGPRGALEITWSLGHESDHVTGASFDDAPNPGDIPNGGGGEFAIYELAAKTSVATHGELTLRVMDRAYFRGPIRHAPGLELDLALRRWASPGAAVVPVLSLYGEALVVDHGLGLRDGGFFSALAGLSLEGRRGRAMPFVSIDCGNGKGLLINRRDVHATIGLRYSPW
jgi:hypothetical protein